MTRHAFDGIASREALVPAGCLRRGKSAGAGSQRAHRRRTDASRFGKTQSHECGRRDSRTSPEGAARLLTE